MKLSRKKGGRNRVGARGERYAARWLFFHGYRILGRNVEMRRGELDIIASRGKYIVFCEVKTRTVNEGGDAFVRPSYAVDRTKREHIITAVKEYLRKNPSRKQPRLDIIEVYLDPSGRRSRGIVQIKGAFGEESR